MQKRSVLLLIALIIVVGYLILQGQNYGESLNRISSDAATSEEAARQAGTAIGMALLLPHLILIVLGAIFNAVGWLGKFRWAALTAAILYTVGGVLGFINFLFLIIPMVLCYVAYGNSKPKPIQGGE